MKSFLANWKTTAAGIALILGALADVTTQVSSGAWDSAHLIADFTAFTGGLGLIFAKDGDVTGGKVKQVL